MARKQIDEHSLGVLEFDAVRGILGSFAASDLGRDAAASLYPSVDLRWARMRMAETSELRAVLDRGERVPMAGLRDIRAVLKQFGKKETVFEPEQLLEIADTLAASGRLRVFLTNLEPSESRHLCAMGEKLGEFTALVEEIGRCVGGDKRVRDNASEKLKEIRRTIGLLSEKIHQRFAEIVASAQLRRAIENDKFLMRHGRPVVAVKANYRHALRGTVLDRSNTGATLYVEPDELVEMSNELEDALFEEKKEVGRILWHLTKLVLDQQEAILDSVRMLALVDLTYAKARFSVVYDMTAPDIRSDGALHLRQARHPLLLQWAARQKGCEVRELTDEVVPIDVRLGDDFDLLLVTGPNTGGKTVVLKTIGLLALMAQSGMHIPARAGSSLSVFRQVYADIGDEQSIQQSLSTFSAHMRQVVKILTGTNDGTLVLLDELGAGTDPIEGAVLATSVLDGLMKRGGKVVATSHLGQLKTYAYTTPRAENASVQFDSETLRPTYHLLIGTPGSSNALVIAKRLGMPKTVLEQAETQLDQESDGTSELINQVQATREDAERKRAEAQGVLDETHEARKRVRERLSRVREQERRIRQQADYEIERSMRAVRDLVERFTAEMQNAPQVWGAKASELAARVAERAAETPLAVRQAQFVETLRRGDSVFVLPFRREGVVDRIHRNRKTLVVFVGNKQIEVSFEDVGRPEPQAGRY
jgi:DNA mismatch repair protein MutS2